MKDVSRRSQLARIASSLGGLLALGLLVVILVVVGKPIVARRSASGVPATATMSIQQSTPRIPPEPVVRASSTPSARDVLMPAGTPSGAPTRSLVTPTPVGAWIRLSPDSGPPGTLVEVQGFLPNGPSPDQAQRNPSLGNATVCWVDCLSGLKEQAVAVHWSSAEPGHFTMQFRVPSIPWLASNGPHALAPGDYTVGIQCLAQEVPRTKGPDFVPCGMQPARATATFHLGGPVPTLCANGSCAYLSFSPNQGPPGTVVQVSGRAPLTDLFLGRPRGYLLVLQDDAPVTDTSLPAREKASFPPSIGQVQQDPNGNLSGSFQVPESLPSLGRLTPGRYTLALESLYPAAATTATPVAGVTVTARGKGSVSLEQITLAPTTFTITAAPPWSSLGRLTPRGFEWSASFYAGPALVADPTDPRRLAYCAPGGIHVTSDGGKTWTTVSTGGAIQAVVATPFQFFQSGGMPPTCLDLVLDPFHPRSFFATFAVLKKPQPSPPPENLIGLVTTDGGQTWQVVPAPPGYSEDQFGGFRLSGEAVDALFHDNASTPGPMPFVAEATTDGGRTWTVAHLPCPAEGPCVRWGPSPSFIGGMGANYPQPIDVSADGGQLWTTPTWPSQIDVRQGPSELVALSPTEVALIAGSAPYPFLLSRDGGQTWNDIALPGLGPASDGTNQYRELQMLPSGGLLARGENPGYGWLILTPGASQWCEVAGASLPASATSFRAIGDRLWWIEPGNTARPPTVGSVAIAGLQCGQALPAAYPTS